MKVARLTAPFKIEFEDAPIPEINDNQVLLKILCFGVCASDQQIYHGKHKYAAMPVVMGHEVAAKVEKVGANVTDFKVGDKVTVQPQVTCGECYPCLQGRFNVCEHLKVIGVHMDGCNCEYVALEPKYLHHITADIPDEQIALAEPLAVGVGSITRSQRFKGNNVVVVGAGTIGNCVAQAAKQLGAGKVMVTDINQAKLDYALECGIDYAINTKDITLKEAIEKTFGLQKADVIVDCVAHPMVFKSILEAARPNSDIILTGNYKEPCDFEVPLVQRREINLLGHMMYDREAFAEAVRLLCEGKITTSKTISQIFPFEKYPEAFVFADEHPNDVMKMIIKVSE
ncbi:MAG: zinc-dependent alcohol dehydrogenase [Eubacteriales bacterium]|jgi:L-iditol 2-dehydrogenase